MGTARQRTSGGRITVIDCFDLTPESIDRLTFAALDDDLSLEAADTAYFANDIALTKRDFRQSA